MTTNPHGKVIRVGGEGDVFLIEDLRNVEVRLVAISKTAEGTDR